MIHRLTEVAKGLLAIAAIVMVLVGVPLLLHHMGGLPGTPILDALADPLASETTRTERLLAGMLAMIAWVCWLQVAYSLIAEAVASTRGTVARQVLLLPGIQAAASRLVATATLVVSSIGQAATMTAAPLGPVVVMEPVAAAPLVVDGGVHPAERPSQAPASTGPTYTTANRETFWSVAETTLGDGIRWHEIRDANIGRTMFDGTTIQPTTEELRTGWQLVLPPDAVLPLQPIEPGSEQVAPELPPEWIEVENGDHFWSIAEEALAESWGRAPTNTEVSSYWADLVQANEGRLLPPEDRNLIYPEQRFQLPPVPDDPIRPEAPETIADPPKEVEVMPGPIDSTAEPATTATTGSTTTIARSAVAVTGGTHPATPVASSDASTPPLAALALGVGGVGVGAGALALMLRRRRSVQAAKRKPGTQLQSPSDELIEYEQRIRPVADTEAARWVAAANKLLTARLAAKKPHRMPAVVAMRAGRFGVEVLLDEPCAPIDGFVPGNPQNSAWRLHPDLELGTIETESEGAQPYCPALVTVGTTEAGDLLLDLEQLGALSVQGKDEAVHAWFRSIAVSIATSEWSQLCEVVVIGDIEGIDGLAPVSTPDGIGKWVGQTATSMQKLHDRLQVTPYELRVNPGEIFHPTVVLITGDNTDAARTLCEVATLVNTPLTIVAACPLPVGERVHLNERQSTLEPAGIEFEHALTPAPEATAVADLLDNADHAPVAGEPAPAAVPQQVDDDREPVSELIERVMASKPIEVRLLQARPSVEGLESDPPTKQLSVICYLAYHRSVTSQRLRDTFWPTATSRKTADNAISQIRSMLGLTEDGEQRLTQAINTGENELSDDVGCDWHRAETLIDAATCRPAEERIELLKGALDLVGGQIGADAPARQFAWLVEDHQVYGHMERVLLDAAGALGDMALGSDDPGLADEAARIGLQITPSSEAMFRLRMRAAAALGEPTAVQQAYDWAHRAAAALGTWSEVESETEALYQSLIQNSET